MSYRYELPAILKEIIEDNVAGTAQSAPKISVPIIAAAMGEFRLPDKTPLIPATNNA